MKVSNASKRAEGEMRKTLKGNHFRRAREKSRLDQRSEMAKEWNKTKIARDCQP